MSDDLEDFFDFRAEMNEKILDSGNLSINRFFNLDTRVYEEGILSSRTKEMLGLIASLVKKCDECIYYHIDRCQKEGVNEEEFYEIFSIALVVGGSIIIPHIRKAVDFMEKLNKKNYHENIDINGNNQIVHLYTDGSCAGNPGPGGYAAIILGNEEKNISGFEKDTTNNRMEIKAVIEGIKHINKGSKIHIYCDSSYVINGITKWIHKWKNNNWKTSEGNLVKNKDLWQKLDRLLNKYKVEFKKVRAHSGDEYNEKVDELAKKQIDENLKK
ncbi:MAG: ribonuclease HI [Bacillota bacterium]